MKGRTWQQNALVTACFGFLFLFIVVVPVSFAANDQDVIADYLIPGTLEIGRQDGLTFVHSTLRNTQKEDLHLKEVVVILFDENNQEILKKPLYIGTTIRANEEKNVTFTTSLPLDSVARITYQVVR